jgi:hypothetical protein
MGFVDFITIAGIIIVAGSTSLLVSSSSLKHGIDNRN